MHLNMVIGLLEGKRFQVNKCTMTSSNLQSSPRSPAVQTHSLNLLIRQITLWLFKAEVKWQAVQPWHSIVAWAGGGVGEERKGSGLQRLPLGEPTLAAALTREKAGGGEDARG